MNSLSESVMNVSVTAHILGGCSIGADAEHGVIDARAKCLGTPACLSWMDRRCPPT